ncbi:MAG TPA: hypothetical protein VN722_08310 [Hanamia sp.]|nr:hypothetical protein [Hanamia sp.]
MEHQLSDTKIYQTVDYNRFRMINGNRGLNLKKIDRIIKDIKDGNNMLRYKPIEVRESGDFLDIIDGQHRMHVSKKIKSPVFYIIVSEDKTMNQIASVNSNVEKWKYTDFINCYVNQGIEDYKRLGQFIADYKIAIGACIRLLQSGNPTYGGQSESDLIQGFCKGTFKICNWDAAVRTVENAKLFSDVFPAWNDRGFVTAVFRIDKAGKVPLSDLVAAVKKNPDKLSQETSPMKYILKLEEILNLGKQKRTIII